MNSTLSRFFASACLAVSASSLYALTLAEQAEEFYSRGVAAEARGDLVASGNCFAMALRAQPSHKATLEKLEAIRKKRSADMIAKAAAAEISGNLAEANMQYALVLLNDPKNTAAAAKLMELQKKLGSDFVKPGAAAIHEKLKNIVVPMIEFEDTPLAEALEFLRATELDSVEIEPASRGINLAIRKPTPGEPDADLSRRRVRELRVRNVPLAQALKYICDQTKTRYVVDNASIFFLDGQMAQSKQDFDTAKMGEKAIMEKLRNIIIPRIDFEDTTIEDAVDFLRHRAAELDRSEVDPTRMGVNFVVRMREESGGSGNPASFRVKTLKVRDVSLETVLKSICAQTQTKYEIDDFVVLISADRVKPIMPLVRSFRVPPDLVARMEQAAATGIDTFGDKTDRRVRLLFGKLGVSFSDPASVAWSPTGELVLRGDAALLRMAEDQLSKLGVSISPAAIPVPENGAAQGKSKDSNAYNAVPIWTSREKGPPYPAEFVGLDGEAVVLRRDGKEKTIPFDKLSADSIRQAKDFDSIKLDILLYYDFSDGAGDIVKDRSGNGRNGTLVGFTRIEAGGAGGASGWIAPGYLMFDGIDDYVTTPLTARMLGNGSFTLEAVVTHADAKDNWSPLFGSGAPKFNAPGVVQFGKARSGHYTSPASALHWNLQGLNTPITASTRPTALCDGRFHHIALLRDAEQAEVRAYFDHRLLETTSAVSGSLNGDAAILIGANMWAPSERWLGAVSEVRITKRALVERQFLSNPNPLKTAAPVPIHRYSFTENVADSIGAAHGKVIDAGQPTAKFDGGRLDLSANQGERGGSPTEDAYAELPSDTIADLKGKATFELWCRPTDWRLHSHIFQFEREDATVGLAYRNSRNNLMGFLGNGSTRCISGSELNLRPGGERHFVLVLDPDDPTADQAGTQTLYLDGYRLATGKMPADFAESFGESKNWLGNRDPDGPMFSGIYNEFRIYAKALGPQEVLASFLAGPDTVFPVAAKPSPSGR